MKNCSVFASLISPSKMIFEVRQKYSAARRNFNSLLGVSSGDEILRLMFDILHEKLCGDITHVFARKLTWYFITV